MQSMNDSIGFLPAIWYRLTFDFISCIALPYYEFTIYVRYFCYTFLKEWHKWSFECTSLYITIVDSSQQTDAWIKLVFEVPVYSMSLTMIIYYQFSLLQRERVDVWQATNIWRFKGPICLPALLCKQHSFCVSWRGKTIILLPMTNMLYLCSRYDLFKNQLGLVLSGIFKSVNQNVVIIRNIPRLERNQIII